MVEKKLDPAISKYHPSASTKDDISSILSNDSSLAAQFHKYVQPDYKLIEELGTGSYGEVIKAVHIKTGTTVAIKFMKGLSDSLYRNRQLLSEI